MPPGKWERRPFMVLQVFIDESGNAPNQDLLVLGGVLSTAQKWVSFTREWDRALAATPTTPRLEFVKFSHLINLEGQFKGWSPKDRDDRLSMLVDIIQRHCIAYTSVSVRWDHFQKYISSVPAGFRSLLNDTPNVMASGRCLMPVILALDHFGLRDKCDFYFDTNEGTDKFVFELWPSWRTITDNLPREVLKRKHPPQIGSVNFRSEIEFLPLQAADLVAGMVRQIRLLGGTLPQFKPLESKWSYHYEMTEADLKEGGDELRQHVRALQQRFPQMPLFDFDPKTAAKTRKRLEKERVKRIAARNKK